MTPPEPHPAPFVWGVATSALQIEGAVERDGRGRSIWEDFQDRPGAIANGDRVDAGAHHYDHWQDDIALMADLGVGAYRFSVAWPRVVPDGDGAVNPAGLGFYDHLVDGLLEAGIEPVVTLYHWDLPSALQARGGWTDPATGLAFARYARVVVDALGDRVERVITHNEPAVAALVGNAAGVHAPGVHDIRTALQVAHGLLVSHGLAVEAIGEGRHDVEVGITLDINVIEPAEPDDADHRGAADLLDGQLARWFLDPVVGDGYPADVLAFYGAAAPAVAPGDMDRIAAPIDFLGVNYYRRDVVAPAPNGHWAAAVVIARDVPTTALGWEVHADGLHDVVARVAARAPGYVMVTENGAAFDDPPVDNGRIHDVDRVAYVTDHVAAIQRCLDEGLPLRGYFLWSLLDNFEWAEGYRARFGIIHSDPDHHVRVLKDSARWYRSHIATWTS